MENPYGLSDIGVCRLAALRHALILANEGEREGRRVNNLNKKVFVDAVIAKGEEIYKLTQPPPKPKRKGKPRIPNELVGAMHADYSTGLSLAEVERKHGRGDRTLGPIFRNRGLPVRWHKQGAKDPVTGRILPLVPKSPGVLRTIISRATRIKIPRSMYAEWRQWPLQKRAEFVATLRARIKNPKDRPTTPFSSNIEPFDYGHKRAHAIMRRLNKGLNSRYAKIKIDLCTQGVIYRGQLWFWRHNTGYQTGPWTSENGRPILHRVIWEKHNRRKIPPKHQVYFIDHNRNNLDPSNLGLRSMAECLRVNGRERLERLAAKRQLKLAA